MIRWKQIDECMCWETCEKWWMKTVVMKWDRWQYTAKITIWRKINISKVDDWKTIEKAYEHLAQLQEQHKQIWFRLCPRPKKERSHHQEGDSFLSKPARKFSQAWINISKGEKGNNFTNLQYNTKNRRRDNNKVINE